MTYRERRILAVTSRLNDRRVKYANLVVRRQVISRAESRLKLNWQIAKAGCHTAELVGLPITVARPFGYLTSSGFDYWNVSVFGKLLEDKPQALEDAKLLAERTARKYVRQMAAIVRSKGRFRENAF